MTHSYDQTLIQRLGFSDPDRKLPAHDDACIEIATDPERFIRAVKELRFLRNGKCDLEVPLQKGDGKYASTVGFIDAIVTWETAKENYSINNLKSYCSRGYDHNRCSNDVKRSEDEIERILGGNYPREETSKWVKGSGVSWWQSEEDYTRSIANYKETIKRNHEHRAKYGNVFGYEDPIHPAKIVARTNGKLLNEQHLLGKIIERKQHIECDGPVPISGPASLYWYPDISILVEVKTKISNVGDILRQMNLYREYKQHHNGGRISDYIIWSLDRSDSKYAKLLSQQGYTLIAGSLT